MERHQNDLTTDAEIDKAFERAKASKNFPAIVEAVCRGDAGWECLMLRLSDGQRLLIPREMLSELKDATVAQATDVFIKLQGLAVWRPQIDDVVYLPDFLEYRWGKTWVGVAA